VTVTFGAGLCDPEDTDDCFFFYYILKEAIYPYPKVSPNGTLEFEPSKSLERK